MKAVVVLFTFATLVNCHLPDEVLNDTRHPSHQNGEDVLALKSSSVQEKFPDFTNGIKPLDFTVMEYAKQLQLEGVLYFAKIRYDYGKYAHIRVFAPYKYTETPPQLEGVILWERLDSPLTIIRKSYAEVPNPSRQELALTEPYNYLEVITAPSVQYAFKQVTNVYPTMFVVVDFIQESVGSTTNFFAKVQYDADKYAHVAVSIDSDGRPRLTGIEMERQLFDPIMYVPPMLATREPRTTTPVTPEPLIIPGFRPQHMYNVDIPSSVFSPVVLEILASPSVATAFKKSTNRPVTQFDVISFGKDRALPIYFAKVRYDEGRYAHIRVDDPPPSNGGRPQLTGIQFEKSIEDPLVYF